MYWIRHLNVFCQTEAVNATAGTIEAFDQKPYIAKELLNSCNLEDLPRTEIAKQVFFLF